MHKMCLSAAELPEAGPGESPTLLGTEAFHHGVLHQQCGGEERCSCNHCVDEKYRSGHPFMGQNDGKTAVKQLGELIMCGKNADGMNNPGPTTTGRARNAMTGCM